MKKFDWMAMESAPKYWPMQVISGSLSYHDRSGSLYVPDGGRIHHGWGKGVSWHAVGDDTKPLPDKLSITFFSYTEDQFYRGEFDLPFERIYELFKKGYYSPNQDYPPGSGGQVTYGSIVVGVAPGGAVSIWLWGINRRTEVFFGQAEKIEGDWSWINTNPDYTRDEYIRLDIQAALYTEERVKELQKNGVPIGRWSTYRTRYNWQPLITGITLRADRLELIEYFNGEHDYLDYPLNEEVAAQTRAVPKHLHYIQAGPNGQGQVFELTFKEEEIFEVFKELGSENQPLTLEMRVEVKEGAHLFSVWLHNDKESIEIKNTGLQISRARDINPDGTYKDLDD